MRSDAGQVGVVVGAWRCSLPWWGGGDRMGGGEVEDTILWD